MGWLGSLLAGIASARLRFVFAVFVFGLCLAPSPAEAQTRRAFLVGNQRYTDGYISPLQRSVSDARDLAKDLEETGFDKKNVKVVTDIKNKAAFDKEFDAFLKTVEPGDFVLFYFSGHGFGVEAERRNYLLFTDLKSPFTFTRGQLKDDERRNPDVIRLRIPRYLDAYQQDEIPQAGVATSEIERKLAERQPKNVVMILDACRSLARTDPDQAESRIIIKRGGDAGSRLITEQEPPPGFMVLYSAQFGEQAVEGVSDLGRNSLFTEVLRSELPRPGQTVRELASRVKLMVRAIALDYGAQQEPEFVVPKSSVDSDDIMLVGSIGRERFRIGGGDCAGDRAEWDQIKNLRKRELLEKHRRRFADCATAELARREIARLALSSEDLLEAPTIVANRATGDCDRLAGSEVDSARPPEVPGVAFDKIEAEEAIAACTKAVGDNPRIPRYLFNLGRAYHKLGIDPSRDRARAQRRAAQRATALRRCQQARLRQRAEQSRGAVRGRRRRGARRPRCDRVAPARRRSRPSARDVQSRPALQLRQRRQT